MAQDLDLAKQTLVAHLQQRQDAGETRVYLSSEAKAVLRVMYKEARHPKQRAQGSPQPRPTAAMAAPPAPPEPTEIAPSPSTPEPSSLPVEEPPAATPMVVAETPPSYAAAPVAAARCVLRYEGATKAEKIAYLKELIDEDEEAHSENLRNTMVFSVGNLDAEIMFVGEAPGYEEENQREPFVGPAGQLLTKIIGVMGLQRESVYISNICKYRPAMPDQGSRNRKPTTGEMQACLPYILAEIEIIQPKVIVALGATGAEGLTGRQEPVARSRGKVRSWNGIPFVVTYHPSYLLRNSAMSERRKVWEDLLLVMEELQMPISEKQRQFFKKAR